MPSVLSGLTAAVSITEGEAPVLLSAGAVLSGDGVFGAGAYLVIRGGAPGDVLGVQETGTGPGQLDLIGSDVYYGGVLIGTISTTGGEYRITFNADVTAAAVEAVVQNLTYQNTSADPAARHELFLNLFDMNGVDLGLTRANDSYAVRTFTNGGSAIQDDGSFTTPFIWDFSGAPTLFSGTSTAIGMVLHQFVYTAGAGPAATSGGSGSLVANAGITNLVYTRGNLYGDATDAIVAGGLDGSLRLFRFNPSSTQQAFATDVGANSYPTLADVDGDGDLDLTVGAANGQLYYFANTGTATDPAFEVRTGAANPFDSITVSGFSAPAFLDVDHDGDMDMVLGSADGTLRYFQNSGGAFTEQSGTDNPFDGIDVGGRSAPFVFDLNGDGRLDLIVGRADGGYTILEAVGPRGAEIDVSITPVNSLPTAAIGSTLTMAEGATATIFAAHMAFTDAETLQGELVYTLTDVPTGTVFLNGIAILAGASFTYNDLQANRVTFQHGGADEGVAQIGYTVTDDDGGVRTGQTLSITITPVNDAPVIAGVTGVAFDENAVNAAPALLLTGVTVSDAEANFNGGQVVVGGLLAEDRISIRNQGDSAGQIGVNGTTVSYGGVAIGTISVAADQTLTVTLNASATNAAVQALVDNLQYANVSDTPTATRDLYVNVRDNAGGDLVNTVSFAAPVAATAFPAGVLANASPELVDLDGDGDLDMLMGGADGFVTYYQNTGTATDPTFTLAATPTGITQDHGSFAEVEAVDMDDDGDQDLFVSGPGSMRYYRNDGNATTPSFTLANTISTGVMSRGPVSTGDLDGDGDMDVVLGAANGNMRYIENTGSTTAPVFSLLAAGQGPAAFTSGTTLTHPLLFDIDGDGDLDMLMGATNGTVSFRENIATTGAAVFGSNQLAYFGASPAGTLSRLTSGDIDGDGDEDIILAVGNLGGAATTTLLYVIENRTARGAPITVTVNAQAEAVAADDAVSTGDNAVLNGSVLADNGSGADDGGVVVTAVNGQAADVGQAITLASGATLTLNADGTFAYAPGPVQAALAPGATFQDSFSYTITGGNTATVTVTVNGADGDDTAASTAGNDALVGGPVGTDTVVYADAASGVRVDLRQTGAQNTVGAGTDTLSGFENLTGSDHNDTLFGTNAANVLRGGLGADTLLGFAGNDTLIGGTGAANTLQGGLGDDTYVVSANDTLVELAGEGTDTVQTDRAAMTLRSNFENLTYTGGSAFIGRGNAENNVIAGGVAHDTLHGLDGNDTLRGGSGAANTLVGGTGDDTYVVAAVGDTIVELVGEGVDTVQTALGHAILSTNIENLTFTDNGAHTGHGNALANVITGGAGFDTLSGLGGNDTLVGGSGAANVLIGGLGDDIYTVTARDTIIEGAGEGTDTVNTTLNNFVLAANLENLAYAGSGNFAGAGNALTNVITGGNGHDTLTGGGGDDILTGGGGQDLMLVSGLRADYSVIDNGDGTYDVVDSVGGRDGLDIAIGVERIRFSNGETVTLASLVAPRTAPAAPAEKGLDGPQVLPGLADDDFLPVKDSGALVLPGLDDLGMADEVQTPASGHMLTDLAEGLGVDPGVAGDGQPGHDGWLF